MSRKRVLIMVDQATRDGLSQLLVAHYLRRKGVTPLVCNQATLVSVYERYRPEVSFVSWTPDATLGNYFRSISDKTHLVLLDQEGGRMGEAAFKRSVLRYRSAKANLARYAARVITWGPSQAQWLRELEVMDERRIVVTGCPRLDPYIIRDERTGRRRYIGVTLRGDPVTSQPRKFMQRVFTFSELDPQDGLTESLPLRAQFEDWIWQVVAVHRHMFKMIRELTRATTTPIVVRPGPWEQYDMYSFLPGHFPQVTVEPGALQHEYVRGACVTVDASSALGLEALLAGTPVVSINSFVPRLEEHVGGKDGARFNAPYRRFYWQPKTIEEAVDCVVRAERGELPLTPDPDGVKRYLLDCHGWPNSRPASFNIGDVILELINLPPGARRTPEEATPNPIARTKRYVYRAPGVTTAVKAAQLARLVLLSPDRQLHRRYHYFDWTYPHHAEIRRVFDALWTMYEPGGAR